MEEGDIVNLKRNPYGTMKVIEILPKGYGDVKSPVVKVVMSSKKNEKDWGFGLIKYFRKFDLKKEQNHDK